MQGMNRGCIPAALAFNVASGRDSGGIAGYKIGVELVMIGGYM